MAKKKRQGPPMGHSWWEGPEPPAEGPVHSISPQPLPGLRPVHPTVIPRVAPKRPEFKVYTQSSPCPFCNALNWTKYTRDQYEALHEKIVACMACKKEYSVELMEPW